MSEAPAATDPSAPLRRGVWPALGWACYLGSSWTWVIGMFLPVLLLRDYGIWGWLAFAVPNVLGAAAMGWVLTPARSRQVVVQHQAALRLFTRVTIAFHGFALPWIAVSALSLPHSGLLWVGASLVLFIVLCLLSGYSRWAAVILVTLLSWAMFAWYSQQAPFATGVFTHVRPPRLSHFDLLCFAPPTVLGFLLCPYLDLTFQRARQRTERTTGRLAFALGFGGVFLSMIVFALCYATQLDTGLAHRPWQRPVLMTLAAFILPQGALTVGLHLRETRRWGGIGEQWLSLVILAAGYLLGAMIGWKSFALPGPSIGAGETIYRCFMLFYGVVFPAYVFLCMIPTVREWRSGRQLAQRKKRWVWTGATLAATPMGYVGFVMGVSVWMLAAVGVIVAARALIELEARRFQTPGF